MVVYVLLVGHEYEGCECLGVYQSRLAAEAAWEHCRSGGYCVIEERRLGAPAEPQYQ
jgi:hypothetical protein